jgi:glutamate-5-semialdehyde dehydrogenase
MLIEMGKRAQAAARVLARTSSEKKKAVLASMAIEILACQDEILAANSQDIANGEIVGLTPALIERLTLSPSRLQGITTDLRGVISLPDPVGEIFDESMLPNGIKVRKQRVPLGVLAVIYESRPNVTIDIAGLAILSGNAVILRGGSETLHSNRALVSAIHSALRANDLSPDIIQFIDDPDRGLVMELLQMYDYVDLLIPRGGARLHEFCRENSRIPVITGGIGVCHLFVDESADLAAAETVIENAKLQRPTVCNALDTVLVHRAAAGKILPSLVTRLGKQGVTFRAHDSAVEYLLAAGEGAKGLPSTIEPAGAQDFDTEWLSLVLGLKVVGDLHEAIAHIEAHSTGHSDGILTHDQDNAEQFVATVDSAAVYVNASTRFTDGSQFGLGAEVAISTQRLHARGPMGLRELTTYKWVVIGDYHVRP